MLLLPPSLLDWLPEGHLAHFILDVVEQLDLSELYAYKTKGEHGTDYGHTPKQSRDNYDAKAGRKNK